MNVAPVTALVTGAAQGIGRAIAERLARDGFSVVAADIEAGPLQTSVEHWAKQGLDIRAEVLDCRNRAGVAGLLDRRGEIAVVVNNAGISGKMARVTDLTRADCADVLGVNLIGAFVVAQEAARRMGQGGRIVNIASRGYLGGADLAHYVASKAAVVAMTRAMAVELRWEGICVNAVAPGMIQTRAIDFFGPMLGQLKKLEPSGEAAAPQAVADVVGFLAGPGGRFVNGQVILVDGGKVLGIPPL